MNNLIEEKKTSDMDMDLDMDTSQLESTGKFLVRHTSIAIYFRYFFLKVKRSFEFVVHWFFTIVLAFI